MHTRMLRLGGRAAGTVRVVGLVCALLMIVPGAAHSKGGPAGRPAGSSSLRGRILDHQGRPVANALVTAITQTSIVQEQAQAKRSARTNAGGTYTIAGLLRGHSYVVHVATRGWISSEDEVPAP